MLAVRRSWRRLGWVALTGLGIGPVNEGLKRLVARSRPLLDDPVSSASGLSYPSGHSSGAAVLALVLVLLLRRRLGRRGRWTAVVVGVAYAGALGLSRVWLGVHYPTDVLGGWLLGTAWVAATYLALRPDLSVRPARCR